MKTILSTNPTFTPGAINAGTLNFSSVNGFNIAGLLAVLNQTTGTLLYATGQASTGYFSWNNSTKVLTLKVDTSSHSSGDQLQVIYDGPSSVSPSGPAITASFTTIGLTNQVVTTSPAILLGLQASTLSGNVHITLTNGSGGNTIIRQTYAGGLYDTSLQPNGADCPNGIYITTAQAQSGTSLVANIYYILK